MQQFVRVPGFIWSTWPSFWFAAFLIVDSLEIWTLSNVPSVTVWDETLVFPGLELLCT